MRKAWQQQVVMLVVALVAMAFVPGTAKGGESREEPAGSAVEDHDLREWPVPWFIGKVGMGLPGLPGVAAEVFLRETLTTQLEGGTGLVGAYGSLSLRYRPCVGCESSGPAAALGIGPELTLIPYAEDQRTAVIATLIIEPAVLWRFHPRFGLMLGLKLGLGWEWDFKNGSLYVNELANVFGIYAGLQF